MMKLEVSANRRFLQYADGRPFFYLGDTAWELFHRLDREEAVHYLDTRARQGFTVVQAVMLAEFDGVRTPNAYGKFPLKDENPATPDDAPGGYWEHVDFIVRAANERGLVIGALPTWGDKWNKAWGAGPEVFTPENAHVYGKWLGERYRDAGIIWVLGGDRPVDNDTHRAILQAMAEGLREGDGGAHLITFHPCGGRGSSEWFHEAPWLDFNMRQNGHEAPHPRYAKTNEDYRREPVKPILDGEPIYEGHPVAFNADANGHSVASDVRRALYWDLFGGACGHTYGHHSIWQMWDPAKRPAHNNPVCPWQEALLAPGARQMVHARHLLESLPYFTRIPDDSVLLPEPMQTVVPGRGLRRFVATRDTEGTYILVYVPVGTPFKVRLNDLKAPCCRARWMDPRTGEFRAIGTFPTDEPHEFLTPDPGELIDWVLVLEADTDDAKEASWQVGGPLTEADTPVIAGPDLLTKDGRKLLLQGVAICGLEWDDKEEHLETSFEKAIGDWRANVIRLAVHNTFWFGNAKKAKNGEKAGSDAARADVYRKRIDALIDYANERGCYVVLDLHEYKAPTETHAAFWRDAAARYANRPGVMFGLLNEAHDISWDEWRNGGKLEAGGAADAIAENTEAADVKRSIGHQKLIEIIRETGAKNVVVAGGLDWAYDLSGILDGYELNDPNGNGVLYDTHIYPWKSDWEGKALAARRKHAVFVGEVGCRPDPMPFQGDTTPDPYVWAPAMLSFLQRNGFHWTAWSFHCHADPNVLQDWTYAPTPYWGSFVRAALRGAKYESDKIW